MAQNRMKFRSLLILFASAGSLVIAIPFSIYWGPKGCAVATSIAIIFAYGLVMNIYYKKKIHIDIRRFWKEIGRMSIVPIFIVGFGLYVMSYLCIDNIKTFILSVIILTVVYVPLFYQFSLNMYERSLIVGFIKKVKCKFNF